MSVYFIGPDTARYIKIGSASDVSSRLAALQIGNPERLVVYGVLPGDQPFEKRIHRALRGHRFRAEWFYREPALALLEELCASDDFDAVLAARAEQERAAKAAVRAVLREKDIALDAAVQSAIVRLIAEHGTPTVIKALGVRGDSAIRHYTSGRGLPEAHRVFNLLNLDSSALDGAFAAYDLRLEPICEMQAIVEEADKARAA